MLPSVVLVVDILGFKQLAQSSGDNEFHRLYESITRAQRHLRPLFAGAYEMKIYTDNIVICWPIGPRRDSESPLGVTILQAALFQLSLACDGYTARGGIAIGNVYADRHVVFGPALIEAHERERRAVQPRIVLAPSAVGHLDAHMDYYGDDRFGGSRHQAAASMRESTERPSRVAQPTTSLSDHAAGRSLR